MKYFFGINMSGVKTVDNLKLFFGKTEAIEDKKADGSIFVTESVPPEFEKRVDEKIDEFSSENEKKVRLSLPLRILRYACAIVALYFTAALFGGEESVTVSENLRAMPWAPFVIAGGIILWHILLFSERKKIKNYTESDEFQLKEAHVDAEIDSAYRHLGVPENAAEVEILGSMYKLKNGEPKLYKSALWDFVNSTVRVWTENGNLCLADVTDRYEIPLGETKCIHYRKKKVMIPAWLKDEPLKSEKYKKYGIKENDNGVILKGYYAMLIEHDGETYELHFPPYELETFEKLIGVMGEENDF